MSNETNNHQVRRKPMTKRQKEAIRKKSPLAEWRLPKRIKSIVKIIFETPYLKNASIFKIRRLVALFNDIRIS